LAEFESGFLFFLFLKLFVGLFIVGLLVIGSLKQALENMTSQGGRMNIKKITLEERQTVDEHQLCGEPKLDKMYKDDKVCQKCESMKTRIKSCLRCDRKFIPGCKNMHMCPRCYYNREVNNQQWNWKK